MFAIYAYECNVLRRLEAFSEGWNQLKECFAQNIGWGCDKLTYASGALGHCTLTIIILWRPRRDLNPCYRRERPVSWAELDDGDVW